MGRERVDFSFCRELYRLSQQLDRGVVKGAAVVVGKKRVKAVWIKEGRCASRSVAEGRVESLAQRVHRACGQEQGQYLVYEAPAFRATDGNACHVCRNNGIATNSSQYQSLLWNIAPWQPAPLGEPPPKAVAPNPMALPGANRASERSLLGWYGISRYQFVNDFLFDAN